MKWLAYGLLLAGCAAVVWHYPFLFELPLIAAIGGAYWLFFRSPEMPPER